MNRLYKRVLLPRGLAQCVAVLYEIPPGKVAYPYHYHTKDEELFYILSGCGTLKTPQGDRVITAGEMLFFPSDYSMFASLFFCWFYTYPATVPVPARLRTVCHVF